MFKKFVGFLLFCLAIFGLVATITLSVSGGSSDYANVNQIITQNVLDYLGIAKLSGFIITTIFIQVMIFSVSAIETMIKKQFNRHYTKVIFLQYGLLVVSIYYNNKFFGANSLVKLMLCILLDVSIIKLVSLSIDLMTANYSYSERKESIDNLAGMIIFNFTSRIKAKVLREYNFNKQNLKFITESSAENIESSVENIEENSTIKKEAKPKLVLLKSPESFVSDKGSENEGSKNDSLELSEPPSFVSDKIRDIVRVIYENKDKSCICLSTNRISLITDYTKKDIIDTKKYLCELGILKTFERKTLINVDQLKAERIVKEMSVNV